MGSRSITAPASASTALVPVPRASTTASVTQRANIAGTATITPHEAGRQPARAAKRQRHGALPAVRGDRSDPHTPPVGLAAGRAAPTHHRHAQDHHTGGQQHQRAPRDNRAHLRGSQEEPRGGQRREGERCSCGNESPATDEKTKTDDLGCTVRVLVHGPFTAHPNAPYLCGSGRPRRAPHVVSRVPFCVSDRAGSVLSVFGVGIAVDHPVDVLGDVASCSQSEADGSVGGHIPYELVCR